MVLETLTVDFKFDPGLRSPYSKYVCDAPTHSHATKLQRSYNPNVTCGDRTSVYPNTCYVPGSLTSQDTGVFLLKIKWVLLLSLRPKDYGSHATNSICMYVCMYVCSMYVRVYVVCVCVC